MLTPKKAFPINAEARGKLRSLKAQLAAQYRRIASTYGNDDFMRHTEALCMKSGKGQDRARVKIVRALASGAYLERAWPDRMLWVALCPRDGVTINSDDPSDSQNCIAANYVIVGDVPETGPAHADGFWTIEFKDHALGRLLMRDRSCDPVKVILAAHHNIHAAPVMLANGRGSKNNSFHLPAGNGVFVCN